MFKVEVTEIFKETDTPSQVVRFTQTVDDLNLCAVITAVNTPKRGPRVKNSKEEKK